MDGKDKLTKTEKILLGLTAVFLCALLALYLREERLPVSTEREAAPETVVPAAEPLDLNTAGAEDLAELPGIGPVLAERIVAYRSEHGLFASPEELLEVEGIGDGKYSALEGLITVK